MFVATSALTLLLVAGQSETRTYRDDKLGLIFQYPRTWTLRKERLYSVFEWDLSGGGKAKVQLINSNFRSPKEAWQQVQKDVNITNKREVLRQWEEVLLGVPLLLTSVQYSESSGPERLLIGLLYSKSVEKFMFRLTAPAAGMDEAERQWREVFVSLRTTSGALPTTENPDTPVETERPPTKPDKVITLKPSDGKPAKAVKAPKANRVTALNQGMNVLTPESWTVADKDGVLVATHPELAGRLVLEIGNTTEAAAKSVLMSASGKTLSRFTSVKRRTETPGGYNQAGFWICQINREGPTEAGELFLSQAIGAGAGVYWLATYESTSPEQARKDRPVLDALFMAMSLEFAP